MLDKPAILCPGCSRKGWTPGCEECAKLNRPKKLGGQAGSRTSSRGGKGNTNGKIKWEWKSFDTGLGTVLREIDRLGNAYQAKESSEAEALRVILADFRKKMLAWHKALTGIKK